MNDARNARHCNGLPTKREEIVALANHWADDFKGNKSHNLDFYENRPGAWNVRFDGKKFPNIPTCALLHVIAAAVIMSH